MSENTQTRVPDLICRAPDLEAWLDRGEQALESPSPAERAIQKVVS